MPEIASIVYKPHDAAPDAPDHYTRIPVTFAVLVEGRGIDGDAKGVPQRQLNIMSAETLAQLAREGFHAGPGQMGEQIALRGLDVDTLAEGDMLEFGDDAQVEVVKPRTGCDRFAAIQGRSPDTAQRRLGVIARVVTGGRIRVGDPVRVVVRA